MVDEFVVGELFLNTSNRFEITTEEVGYFEFSSGSVCEVQVGEAWIRTSIEHGPGGYYFTRRGLSLEAGLMVRVRRYC